MTTDNEHEYIHNAKQNKNKKIDVMKIKFQWNNHIPINMCNDIPLEASVVRIQVQIYWTKCNPKYKQTKTWLDLTWLDLTWLEHSPTAGLIHSIQDKEQDNDMATYSNTTGHMTRTNQWADRTDTNNKQIKRRWALFVTYTIIMRSEMCSLHLTHQSAHTWSSGQPTVQRPGSSRWDSNPLGLPRVSSPTLYPLGQRLPNKLSSNELYLSHTQLYRV